jgi:hypothetical protein
MSVSVRKGYQDAQRRLGAPEAIYGVISSECTALGPQLACGFASGHEFMTMWHAGSASPVWVRVKAWSLSQLFSEFLSQAPEKGG